MTVVVVGEGLLELSRGERGWMLGHGGDTLNTAVHLARFGEDVAYATALGADQFSIDLLRTWRGEGIDTRLVLTDPARLPGLYAVHNDQHGDRSFSYWRSASAARRLFDLPGQAMLSEAIARASLLYFSLISLAVLDDRGRTRMMELASETRAGGGLVAFDGNYRPQLWTSASEATRWRDAALEQCDIGLPTFEDERLLAGAADAADVAAHWERSGAGETVVKLGADGCLIAGSVIAPIDRIMPLDTSGAGDAFNAGYLHARLRGAEPADAAAAGHRIAGWTIQRMGASPPRDEDAPYA